MKSSANPASMPPQPQRRSWSWSWKRRCAIWGMENTWYTPEVHKSQIMNHKSLIIVESPTKSRTISKFLGNEYVVRSSYGHVRDLPKSKLGVDTAHGFKPQYVIPPKAKKVIAELEEEAKKADEVILASDEDREGEAISWHLAEALGLEAKSEKRKAKRIVFHEITKSAIQDALKHPRELDMNLVDAQQARRGLDRLVGYELSPFLWKKIT